jgi:NarL family two-component system response regulator LiaR
MTTTFPIRTLIVDDHYRVRQGLALMLLAFDDLQLAGQAADGEEALRLCAEAAPDVVLMDLLMPVMDGVAATRAIREQYPSVQVVAISNALDEHRRRAALEAGAHSCIGKHVSIDELAAAIRAAHAQARNAEAAPHNDRRSD